MTPQRPKVSRKPIVLLVSLCLIVSAVLIPVALKLPRWVEIELVLGAWWLVWVIAMVVLLYRGHAVDDDAEWMGGRGKRSRAALDWLSIFPGDIGCLFEGCSEVLIAILAFLLLGLAVFVVVELIIPAIALLLLASIGGMFARAVNDTHDCQGRLGLSLFWGVLWATVYIGPVAAIAIWVSNYLAHRS